MASKYALFIVLVSIGLGTASLPLQAKVFIHSALHTNMHPFQSPTYPREIAFHYKPSFTSPYPPTERTRYLLRAEIIALHAASSYPGAQLYMECAQIAVTGGGNGNPATVSFPGAYKGTDPGIKFQLYWPVPTSYTIPGPRPFVC